MEHGDPAERHLGECTEHYRHKGDDDDVKKIRRIGRGDDLTPPNQEVKDKGPQAVKCQTPVGR